MPFLWSCLMVLVRLKIICYKLFFYLEYFHHFGYDVAIFVEDNPFGRIKNIYHNNLGQYKMLYQCCSDRCENENEKNM